MASTFYEGEAQVVSLKAFGNLSARQANHKYAFYHSRQLCNALLESEGGKGERERVGEMERERGI